MELLLLFTNYSQTMGLKRKKFFPCFVKYTHMHFLLLLFMTTFTVKNTPESIFCRIIAAPRLFSW